MVLSKNEFVENKINTKFLKVLTLILLFVLLCGINNTYVYYASLTPFGVGIVFSLLFIGFNGYILSVLYFVSLCVLSFGLTAVLQSVNVALVLCIIEYLRTEKCFKIKKWYLFLLMLSALISYIVSSCLIAAAAFFTSV